MWNDSGNQNTSGWNNAGVNKTCDGYFLQRMPVLSEQYELVE